MFPQRLITPCILCGCPENGIVLDPFIGSGTTAIVAKKHFRKYIGCEINPGYVKIAERRIAEINPLFD
jgi:site-specific DNA-methyltransferase (adenine-specific)